LQNIKFSEIGTGCFTFNNSIFIRVHLIIMTSAGYILFGMKIMQIEVNIVHIIWAIQIVSHVTKKWLHAKI